MRKASELSVGTFRGHGVCPLDRQGIDGPSDEHHQGQAQVKEIHFLAFKTVQYSSNFVLQ